MKPRLKALALAALIPCLLSSCSIENEYQEKVSVVNAQSPAADLDPALAQFISDAQQCVLGKTSNAMSLLTRFNQSLTDKTYLYQDPLAVTVLEKCLRKSDAENDTYLYIGYIPSSLQCAGLSQAFYERGENTQGIFWLRRVVNQLGLAGGYELAGSVFIEHPKTLSLGARLLSEAAKQGSDNAGAMLMELISGQ